MATWTYVPDFSASVSTKPTVDVVKFGDGYEQRIPQGLNTLKQSWSLRFSVRTDTDANGMIAFLEARAAVESFDWTAPGSVASAKWVCREWSRSIDKFNLNTVNAVFERVYEP